MLDCDVIVAEVRETSRKPDEIYGVIERLTPGTRKLGMCLCVTTIHEGRNIWTATQHTTRLDNGRKSTGIQLSS